MRTIKFIAKFVARLFTRFIVGVIVLISIVLVSMQTPVVKKQIVRIVESQASKMLNAELSIGKLGGNFFTNLTLDNIALLSAEKDTVVSISQVQLNYRLLPLLNAKIIVENIAIENPYLHLKQLPDSSWNVMHIVKQTENEPDTTSSSFDMLVLLDRFALSNGVVKIDAFEENIPERIQNLNIALSGLYSAEKQQANLSDFRLKTQNPDIELLALNLKFEGDTTFAKLHNLLLQTAENRITAKGEYHFSSGRKSCAELKTQPIVFDEFKAFLPADFHFVPHPKLNLFAELRDKQLNVDVQIKDGEQEVDLKILSHQLLEYLSDSTISPVFLDLVLTFREMDLRYWLDNPEMNYQIDGALKATAEGLNPQTMRASIDADFGNTVVHNNLVEHLGLQLNYLAGNLDGDMIGRGDFGSLHFVSRVEQLLENNPSYNFNFTTRNLNVSTVFDNEEYETNINLNLGVKGSGFETDKMNVQATIVLEPSTAMGLRLDTLNAQIDFVHQNIAIRQFFLEALGANLQVAGNYNLQGNSELALEVKMVDVHAVSEFVDIENFETSLNLNAQLSGQIENLNIDLQLSVGETRFQEIIVDSINMFANGRLQNNDMHATADLKANNLAIGDGVGVDELSLRVETDTKSYKIALWANGEDIQARLNSVVWLGNVIRVNLFDLMLGYKDYVLHQASDTAFVRIGGVEYEIRDFHLLSDSISGFPQSIYADGIIHREASQNFKFDINNFDVERLTEMLQINQNVGGYASLNASLTGEASSPQLAVSLNVDSAFFGDFHFDTLRVDANLLDKELSVHLNIVPQNFGHIQGEARLPVDARLDSTSFDAIPKETDSIFAHLLFKELPLSVLKMFVEADEVAGQLNSEINVSGIANQPQIIGNLKINDGKLRIEQYGIKYNFIQTDIQVQEKEVNIDTFIVRSPNGNMIAQGNVKFNSEPYNADLNSSHLSVQFEKFNPFDHKQFNMELSGDVNLMATADSARFSGDIVVPKAYIYLPAILNLMGQFSAPDIPRPLLVKELEKLDGDSLVYHYRPDKAVVDTTKSESQLEFLNNLQGEIKVRIPRNTWIRNDDMRIELSGDVELIKHKDFYELFGTIDVVRGQYNLLGKVFVVQSGTISFQGGQEINPILNIQAVYSFRDSFRNKRNLGIDVTGDVDNLVIKFDLDGSELNEGDALSYIVFGRALNELSTSEQSNINTSDLAGTAASSLLSSQVNKFLGNTGLVDYIEVDVGSSFDSGSLTVGKYITNRLFVSYEQRIGNIEDKSIARYEMTLEYELFKFLFAQLTSSPVTSGFDLIFKINSKNR